MDEVSRRGSEDRQKLFDRAVGEYGDALWRLAAGYAVDHQDRMDLRQDIHVALWKALRWFRGESSLRTFVYRIAHNRGLSHRARVERRTHRSLDDIVVSDPRPGPAERTTARRRREMLHEAIRRLSPTYRQTVMLHLDGLANEEIAEVLGVSAGNVAVRLTRARKALRKILEGAEDDQERGLWPPREAE